MIVFVVARDYGEYEGWLKPEAVCDTRAAALAYIGTRANDHMGGTWQIVELPVQSADGIAARADAVEAAT